MLRLDQIKLNPDQKEDALRARAARLLRVPAGDILSLRVLRRAVDAREELTLVYTLAVEVRNEQQVLRRCHDRRVSVYEPKLYTLPQPVTAPEVRPIVVGAGPAGLFAALVLSLCGARPILLERGQPTERRIRDVETFWSGGALDTESNVQFGEGGAGAFSDGKLNTGTRDLRHRWILEQMVSCGAPDTILTDAKPHVGTDKLHITLQNLRRELQNHGADIRFGHRLDKVHVKDGRLTAVDVTGPEGTYTLPARQVILAPGHSARDTFAMLYEAGAAMEQKPFAVGVRIEHRQADMDAVQYKTYVGHPGLGAASYKLSCHLPDGRSAFSFCVCPGGQVVAAASETGQVVTNGMSEYAEMDVGHSHFLYVEGFRPILSGLAGFFLLPGECVLLLYFSQVFRQVYDSYRKLQALGSKNPCVFCFLFFHVRFRHLHSPLSTLHSRFYTERSLRLTALEMK